MDVSGKCPVTTAVKILSGKWTLRIVYLLSKETLRFNALQRALGNLTQATLTKQLRTMEENGLVVRTVYNQIPPRVEYSLSELGRQLNPVVDALEVWGNECLRRLPHTEA